MPKFKARIWERVPIWELREVEFEDESLEDAKYNLQQEYLTFDNYGPVEEWMYSDEDYPIRYELQDGTEVEEVE